MTMTPDGGSKVVIFDIFNSTIYPGHPEFSIRAWQPFKLYTSPTIMSWMTSQGKKFSAYYNDFKWFKD